MEYLKKTLTGVTVSDDECYILGKYIGCIEDIVENYIGIVGWNFSCNSNHSKRHFKEDQQEIPGIFFRQLSKGLLDIPYMGYPFSITSTKQWQCTLDDSEVRNNFLEEPSSELPLKRKKSTTACKATIKTRTIKLYNEHGISVQESEANRQMKEKIKTELLTRIKNNESIKTTEIHYCCFPLPAAHTHNPNSDQMNNRLDKRVIRKIKDLAKNGITDIASIRQLVTDFVENTLFSDYICKPTEENKRFYPTDKTIRNHVFLTLGSLKNKSTVGSLNTNISGSEDQPAVTNIITLPPKKFTDPLKVPGNVGVIAIHLGAGYHSPQKWPAYKQICDKTCRTVQQYLTNGMTAGEAAAKAVQLLEESEYTNAGFGSNLTENGDIECDASIMDTEQNEAGTCNSYFGAIANVSKVRSPALGAFTILHEQRKKDRLSLNRIPPCFLSGSGAEKWCLAHGVEMCSPQELISETATKDWKKYRNKLMKHLVSADDNQSQVENFGRMDTVGAVTLDVFGNVASTVSSGGILMKLPGRIGQAACYGCGCWAERLEDGNSVAVSTSGVGEQIIKTMLAQRCAENLKSFEQPYEALQSSPRLRLDEDKFVGLLSLHLSKSNDNTAVEIVWGHTTHTMIVAHMSTNDTIPQVDYSKLSTDSIPGKSVTVAGAWIKVPGVCEHKGSQQQEYSVTDNENIHGLETNTSLDGNMDTVEGSKLLKDTSLKVEFISCSQHGIRLQSCETKISEIYNRKVLTSHIDREESIWKAKICQNKRLFNGQKFRLHSLQFDEKKNKILFKLGITSYKDFITTNMLTEFEDILCKNNIQLNEMQSYMADPLGVAGIVITADNKIILQKRSAWVAENPNTYDVPGGHAEPVDACGGKIDHVTFDDLEPHNVTRELFESELNEVTSEVNIPKDNISELVLLGVVRHKTRGCRPVVYFGMACNLTSNEILSLYSKGGNETDESTQLLFLDDTEESGIDDNLLQQLCSNAKAALGLYFTLKRKGFKLQ